MQPRRKLSDILQGSKRDEVAKIWANTKAAPDFGPLPAGSYLAYPVEGTGHEAKSGKESYKITWRVAEGEFASRLFWSDYWFTPKTLPITKRELAKLGVTDFAQLDNPLPQGIRCKVRLVLKTSDDGTQFNELKEFTPVAIDPPPEPDAFAPPPASRCGRSRK